MSCHGCATKFSFFSKELCCPSCKFSFCIKCLKQKALVEGKLDKVCFTCYQNLTGKEGNNDPPFDTPSAFLKRLENLEKVRVFQPFGDQKMTSQQDSINLKDKEMLERLEKLRTERLQNVPSEDEIRRRLDVLHGKDFQASNVNSQNINQIVGVKLQPEEEVNNLLKQYIDETKMEVSEDIVDTDEDDHEAQEEEAAMKIIKKTLAEVKLEEHVGSFDNNSNSPTSDLEGESELPWCAICNEDASIKCLDCECLYCSSCFTECHEEFGDLKTHKSVLFQSKKTQSQLHN